jgi:hypothetical protein
MNRGAVILSLDFFVVAPALVAPATRPIAAGLAGCAYY